ncbi:unannotated protein [freshwater metagenome]|uniref:Unannotated protein n=1 Tax=freshwater metagenome TaxID=449393 RepID=A0A6J6UWR1_9ZZZZ
MSRDIGEGPNLQGSVLRLAARIFGAGKLRIPSLTGANAAAVAVQASGGFFACGPASDKMLRWQILQLVRTVQ